MLAIRRFDEGDVFQCLSLDPGYSTDRVLQLERHEEADETTFVLRTVVLPRPRYVDGFPIEPPLDEQVRGSDLALLIEGDEVAGYVLARRNGDSATLSLLVVRPDQRRHGIGGRLLGELRTWARSGALRSIRATVESRNYPAMRFLKQYGFSICGVRDAFGRNEEVLVSLESPIGFLR